MNPVLTTDLLGNVSKFKSHQPISLFVEHHMTTVWNDPTGKHESMIFDEFRREYRKMTDREHQLNNLGYFDKDATQKKRSQILTRVSQENSHYCCRY